MSKLTVTDAGQKYLELYAEPVVTNTYLKVAVLVLSSVSGVLLLLLYRAQTAALHLKPLILSVTGTGRTEVLRYEDLSSVPVERVSKYYLARWASLYYGRNHATLQRDFSESLNFFSADLQSATVYRVQKSKALDGFLLNPAQPNIDIEVRAVTIEDLRQSPYRARIEFDKVFRSPGDLAEVKRERWTTSIVYSFRDQVPNQMLLTNPLGLAISYVHEDEAFER